MFCRLHQNRFKLFTKFFVIMDDVIDPQAFDEDIVEVQTEKIQPVSKSPPHTAAPLDLSFKTFICANDISEDIDSHQQANLQRSSDSNKYSCSAIRLNNNGLCDMERFAEVMSEVVENIDDIAWLDLSFNELESISEELLKFRNVKVLHLHGNTITKLEEINKLSTLPQLRSLTLHGNPIETEKEYRQYVLSMFPSLKTLDFSAVTKQDRTKAEVWAKMKPKGLKRRTNKKTSK